MLITVILDRDLDVLPAHVQIRIDPTPLVANSDLGLRAGKPGIQQQEPQPGLLRRLCSAVDQLKSGRSAFHPPAATVAIDQQLDVDRLQSDRLRERIDRGNSIV